MMQTIGRTSLNLDASYPLRLNARRGCMVGVRSTRAWMGLQPVVPLRQALKLLVCLLHHRLHDRVLEITVKFPVGIVGLHHENANDFLLRVHPKMCPESAVPTIAAIGNAITRGDRVAHHLL